MRALLLAFLSALSLQALSQADSLNVYSPRNVRKFADHLYMSRQYRAAASEYERLWLLDPSSDSAAGLTIRSLRIAGDYHSAMEKAHLRWDKFSLFTPLALQEYVSTAIWADEYSQASYAVAGGRFSHPDSLAYQLNIKIISMDFAPAHQLIDFNRAKQGPGFRQQEELLARGESIRYKKPWLAAGLSAVVPGSGKVYTRDWKDGLFSFVSIGLLGYQSYKGFSTDGIKSPLGWITGGLALGFYSANIYGSAKAARRFNQKQQNDFRTEAKNILYPVF